MIRSQHIAMFAALPALAGSIGCSTSEGSALRGLQMPALFAPRSNGEQWMILCIELTRATPNRRRTIDQLADALRQDRRLDGQAVRTMHGDDASAVYCGMFKPKMRDGNVHFEDADRAYVQYIRSLAVGASHPFLEARLVPAPTDDVGPPQWNVRNCPEPYTLHIADFYNTVNFNQRKESAVQYCRLLREKGYEAYYWHGHRRSFVCVGALRRGREFLIRPDGIILSPKLQELIDGDTEFQMKYQTVNGRFISERMLDKSIRRHSLPIACPDRPRPTNEDWLREHRMRPLHR